MHDDAVVGLLVFDNDIPGHTKTNLVVLITASKDSTVKVWKLENMEADKLKQVNVHEKLLSG